MRGVVWHLHDGWGHVTGDMKRRESNENHNENRPENGIAERYFFLGNQIIAVDRSWCHGH